MKQELDKFFAAASPFSFRDIAGDRDRRSAHLSSQAEYFVAWELPCAAINFDNEFGRSLPDQQVSVG
jgi:hypothetical protein